MIFVWSRKATRRRLCKVSTVKKLPVILVWLLRTDEKSPEWRFAVLWKRT